MSDRDQNPEKEVHRQISLGFLTRDVAEAKRGSVVLGFKISARTDAMWEFETCPRAAGFSGVYLVDELPDLYPADCPDEECCCCIDREAVLSCDDTPESKLLRDRIAERGLPTPPPPWAPMEPLSEERKAEMLAMIDAELKDSPAKHAPMWEFLRGIFAKKPL